MFYFPAHLFTSEVQFQLNLGCRSAAPAAPADDDDDDSDDCVLLLTIAFLAAVYCHDKSVISGDSFFCDFIFHFPKK